MCVCFCIHIRYLIMGEEAEHVLLEGIVKKAKEGGISDIRLRAPWQVCIYIYV